MKPRSRKFLVKVVGVIGVIAIMAGVLLPTLAVISFPGQDGDTQPPVTANQ